MATLFTLDAIRFSMVKVVSPLSQREVEAVNVDFEAKAEPWASYELSDGSILKVRTVVSGVQRLEGEHDQGGNPMYMVQSATMVRVVSAKKELRGPPTIPTQLPGGTKTTGGPEVR